VLASLAASLGLVGVGVHAGLTSGASATASVNVGTFGCSVTSSDPNAVASGNSVTITLPPIVSSAASYRYVQDVTVTNTGSSPELVHWTFTQGGTLAANQWQGSGGLVGYTTGTSALNMTNDVVLQPTGGPSSSVTYGAGGNGVGFTWAALDNTYLGKTATLTYTANCGGLAQSNISFVGAVSAAVAGGTAPKVSSVTCPAGTPNAGSYPWVSVNANNANSQWCGNNTFPVASTSGFPSSGSFTVAASGGTATISYTGVQSSPYVAFTGLTNTSAATGYVTPATNNVTGVLAPTALPLPSGWQPGDYAVAINVGTGGTVPAGFTQISSMNYIKAPLSAKVLAAGDQNITIPAGSGTTIGVVVYRNVASVHYLGAAGNPGGVVSCPDQQTQPLQVMNGSSWVACVVGANSTGVSMNGLAGMTTRDALADTHVGFADTNGGVATFAGATGGSTGTSDDYGIELVSK
jgi:hypothetical protein